MRKAARIDANQPAIVKAFRSLGASVQHLHMVGGGCPDVIVGYESANYMIEIKDGAKPPSKQAFTEDEARWHDEWKGQVETIRSEQEAIDFLMSIRKEGL